MNNNDASLHSPLMNNNNVSCPSLYMKVAYLRYTMSSEVTNLLAAQRIPLVATLLQELSSPLINNANTSSPLYITLTDPRCTVSSKVTNLPAA